MEKKGFYSMLASLATSLVIVVLFYVLGMQKVQARPDIYTEVDVYGGIVFMFILSMIVSASIWPGLIERRSKH